MPNPHALPCSLSRVRERAGVRARDLRQTSTDAERVIWNRLRNRQLGGFKFRRQHPVCAFIADFVCLEANLIVELDGGQHFEPEVADKDQRRTAALAKVGFEVMRFDNRQVLLETDAVLLCILMRLQGGRPHPSPLPQAGEGAKPNPLPQAGEGENTERTP